MPRITTMQHKVGNKEDGFLWAGLPNGPFEAIFEDDGETGYFYGLDNRRKESGDNPIVHALHIYNVASVVDPHAEYPMRSGGLIPATGSGSSSRAGATQSSTSTKTEPSAERATTGTGR